MRYSIFAVALLGGLAGCARFPMVQRCGDARPGQAI